jgi:hypothetical protein
MTPEMEIRAKALEIAAILLAGSGIEYLKDPDNDFSSDLLKNYAAVAAGIQDMIAGG